MYNRRFFTALIIIISFMLSSCRYMDVDTSAANHGKFTTNSKLNVNFIDVGQGDSIFIESAGKYMLIDAGENDKGETVCSYLENAGVDSLEYVIGTHPHSDHIGGLDTVINNFDVKNVIMPNKTTNTKTFEDVLTALENKNLSITPPVVGDKYTIGNAEFTIIAPVKDDYGDELNNYSAGIKLVCGETSFVMCGDAEKEAEKDIVSSGTDIKANVLKLGHHGSSTSSCGEFLDAVSPETVVISCGKDNKYGHPHKETIDEAEKRGLNIMRTDEYGTITAQSDGKEITWVISDIDTEYENSVSLNSGGELLENTYILNTKTKKFHIPGCSSAVSTENKQTFKGNREELISKGYTPCRKCSP